LSRRYNPVFRNRVKILESSRQLHTFVAPFNEIRSRKCRLRRRPPSNSLLSI